MKILKKLKRRSTTTKLAKINARRCKIAALITVAAVPAVMLTNTVLSGFGGISDIYEKYFLGMGAISLAELAVLKLTAMVKGRREHLYRLTSNIYVIAMASFFLLMADGFLADTGSLAFYFAALLFAFGVPAFDIRQLAASALCALAVMSAYMVKYIHNPGLIFQVLVINLLMVIVCRWKYYTVLKRMELEKKGMGSVNMADALYTLCERQGIPVGLIAIEIETPEEYETAYLKIGRAVKEVAGQNNGVAIRAEQNRFFIFVQELEEAELFALSKKVMSDIRFLLEAEAPEEDVSAMVSIGAAYGYPGRDCTGEELYRRARRTLGFSRKENRKNEPDFPGSLYSADNRS